jgi:hypothetical protein
METNIFLEREPVANFGTKGGCWKVRHKTIEDDLKEINGCAATTAKEIWEDSQEAATGGVKGTITSGKHQVHVWCPWVP